MELLALAVLRSNNVHEDRNGIIAGLRSLAVPEGTVSAVGPVAGGIASAMWSLMQARLTLELGADAEATRPGTRRSGAVLDAEEFAVERFAVHSLVESLGVWLDSGCNTAQAARELHVERQSMHQRLQRIFALCGGGPRGTGGLAALHLAARLTSLPQPTSGSSN